MQTDSAQPAVSNDYPMGVLPPELGSSEEMASYLGPVAFSPASTKTTPSLPTTNPQPVPVEKEEAKPAPLTTNPVVPTSPVASPPLTPPTTITPPPQSTPTLPSTDPAPLPKTVVNTAAVPQVDALSPPEIVQGPIEAKPVAPPPPPTSPPVQTAQPETSVVNAPPGEASVTPETAPTPPAPQHKTRTHHPSLLLTLVFILGGLFSLGALGALALYFFTAEDPQMLNTLTEMFSFLSHPASLVIPIALLFMGGVLLVIGVKAPEKN